MKQHLVFSTLLSVFAISFSALHDNNRYGAPHSRNSLNYRGGNRYSAPHHGPSLPHAPSSPHSPRLPHAPSAPHSPRLPHGPRAPVSHSYGAPRNGGYGSRTVGGHQPGPVPYGGGRHYGSSGSNLNQYHGPAPYSGPGHYSAGPAPYGGHGQVHASSGASHYASAKRSVYQQPQEHQSYSSTSRSGYPHQQNYAQSQQHAQSSSTSHGREMKYTIKDPQNKGTTHVTETHVVSNRQMHGAEAEAAMKKLMGSMGPSSPDGGFNDFLKGMGLPFY